MASADKKQRHKLKRNAKRAAAKRRDSISPVKRLADARGNIECWMSDRFEDFGQEQIFVYKQAGRLTGVACFLVDRGIAGLKDAWTRIGIDRMEFQQMLDACAARGIPMRLVSQDEARRMIAGGIRWAHDNGMRLPKDWTKPSSLIGGVGDWESAGVSAFEKEFAGHPEDLRARLIAKPFDDFIRQTDVSFVFSDAAPYMDQETGDYLNDDQLDDNDDDIESITDAFPTEEFAALLNQFAPAATMLMEETTTWLAARSESPSSELFEAWRTVMLASFVSKVAMGDAPDEEAAELGFELIRDFSGRIDDHLSTSYGQAVGQVLEHLETDSALMQRAVLTHG